MPSFPVRKYHHSRPCLPNNSRNLKPVLPCVLNPPIRNIQSLTPGNSQDLRRVCCFLRTVFRRASRAHLTARQIENSRSMSECRHLEQSPTTGLFHIIAVCGNG